MAKDALGEGRFSTKFSDLLHELSNTFVHHLADEANKLTLSKKKSKILEEDILKVLLTLGFTEQDFEAIRARLKDFEDFENGRKESKNRFRDGDYQKRVEMQNEILAEAANGTRATILGPIVETQAIQAKDDDEDFD